MEFDSATNTYVLNEADKALTGWKQDVPASEAVSRGEELYARADTIRREAEGLMASANDANRARVRQLFAESHQMNALCTQLFRERDVVQLRKELAGLEELLGDN